MKRYHILILSNLVGSGLKDDNILKKSFEKDGHHISMDSVSYDEQKDGDYDVIIRRNTWVSKEEDTSKLSEKNKALVSRLNKKGIKTVNLEGLDYAGKGYLTELYKKKENVIPTIKTLDDFHLIKGAKKYVLKDIKSFGNGLYQKFVSSEEVSDFYKEGDIIQPFMEFKSELQCYYVADKFMYAYRYTPSKYPNYPEPELVSLTEKEKELADKFAKYSGLKYGFLRIDFLRLSDDSLMLMEIEDHAAFMNLQRLPKELLSSVVDEFKTNIYTLLTSE